jgi:hypothetical protein
MKSRHVLIAFNPFAAFFWLRNLVDPVPALYWVPAVCQNPCSLGPARIVAVLAPQLFPPFLMFLWLFGNVILAVLAIGEFIDNQRKRFVRYAGELPDRLFRWHMERFDRKMKRRNARWLRHPRLRWLFDIHEFIFP